MLCFISVSEQARGESAKLSISPESCLATSGICTTTLTINWQMPQPAATCLKMSDRKVLMCFAEQEQHTEVKIDANRPVTIELLHKETHATLATSTLNVLVKEHNKRRRQRHVWSVII